MVTVTLLNGETVRGHLERFNAAAAALTLWLESRGQGRAESITYGMEELASVAIARGCELQPSPPRESERWRVRMAGGKEWLVQTSAEFLADPLGCMAQPVGDDRFEAVFLYGHAINLHERDVPIGSLLLKAGVLEQSALEKGVARQAGDRSIPIGRILIEQAKADAATLDEAAELQKRKGSRIGEVLQEAGLLSGDELNHALLEQQRRKGRRLGEALVDLGLLSERELAVALGKKFALPFVNLRDSLPAPEALSLVGPELARKYNLLPLADDGHTLTVAVSDPTHSELVEVLRRSTKRQVRLVIATSSELKQSIEAHVRVQPAPIAAPSEPEAKEPEARAKAPEDGIGRVLEKVLNDALRREVTEIHIESNGKEKSMAVRYRINGLCPLQTTLPPIVRHALVTRIKTLAKLDLEQRGQPQMGSLQWLIDGRPRVELRVLTLPTGTGEEDITIHARTIPKALSLEATGLSATDVRDLKSVMAPGRGLVLCVGPAGSGKTTMLAALSGALNRHEAKSFVIDDMAECLSPNTRHLVVQSGSECGYELGFCAALRAGGDIITLGELDDRETIRLAADAVLRGRLVLAGMVVENAYEAYLRLINAGLSTPVLAETLAAIITTRTVRTLCRQCAVRESASEQDYDRLVEACGHEVFAEEIGIRSADQLGLWRPAGCAQCGHTGYQGRIGLQDVLLADDEVKQLLVSSALFMERRNALRNQSERALMREGARHVLAGRLDLPQLFQVCAR